MLRYYDKTHAVRTVLPLAGGRPAASAGTHDEVEGWRPQIARPPQAGASRLATLLCGYKKSVFYFAHYNMAHLLLIKKAQRKAA